MVAELHHSDEPILDTPYLDDMREWVGGEALITLLACAPEALKAELAILRAAWDRADLSEVRETGHRLKGAAGSVACRRLAAMGHTVQTLRGLDESHLLDMLDDAVEAALSAIAAYAEGLKA